ncbi:Zinc/iron permease [Pilobolus umbonatus]|nr:Zinc/iron permease [Pilobolus umbonatus]
MLFNTYFYLVVANSMDLCEGEMFEDYNMRMRVAAIFIILGTSAIGIFTPIILRLFSPQGKGGFVDWILQVGKFFGTGVILSTAFIHLFAAATSNFESECLDESWHKYHSYAGIFCMFASFAIQLLEVAALANLTRLREQKLAANKSLALEKGTLNIEKGKQEDHGHVHSAGLLEEDAFKHVGTLILEFGIAMHSVIIGITLSTVATAEFNTLLIALVFHQFFEGIALGTRINDLKIPGWRKPLLMGLIFIVMTPIGSAIGIGVHSSFNPFSSASIITSGVLDAISAGILIYNGFVSLMSLEITHSKQFHRDTRFNRLTCLFAMYCGAGFMSLLGKWA